VGTHVLNLSSWASRKPSNLTKKTQTPNPRDSSLSPSLTRSHPLHAAAAKHTLASRAAGPRRRSLFAGRHWTHTAGSTPPLYRRKHSPSLPPWLWLVASASTRLRHRRHKHSVFEPHQDASFRTYVFGLV
jgi:hypothetical protein